MTPPDRNDPHDTRTGGGASVGGDVDIQAGDFIGRDRVVHGDEVRGDKVGGDKVVTIIQRVVLPTEAQQERNRRAMIEKVRINWIEGVFEKSLYREVLIRLGLEKRPEAVVRPVDLLVRGVDRAPFRLPANTKIVEVFDRVGGALLILGAPGTGKTTLLLELARDLLARAEADSSYPIPVVFTLSSWATNQRPLADWLIDELNRSYQVPRKVATAWVGGEQILPLLDGLDEVRAEVRGDCVEAINTFRREQGLAPLVVCSRLKEYEELNGRLVLQDAVVVQALTSEQVGDFSGRVGEQLAGLRAVLGEDGDLRELLDTPLMLSIAALTYEGKSAEELKADGQGRATHDRLFTAYVDRMLQRRGSEALYRNDQTVGWLGWLAWQMVRNGQTVFLLERMQPDWLSPRFRWIPTGGVASGGGVVSGLAFGLVFSLSASPIDEVVNWWLVALLVGLVTGAQMYQSSITTVETVRWARPSMRSLLRDIKTNVLGLLLINGLFFGLLSFLLAGGVTGALFGALFGLVVGGPYVAVAGAVLGALRLAVSIADVEVRTTPNEGIYRSGRNALQIGLAGPVTGVACGLIFGLYIEWFTHLDLRLLYRPLLNSLLVISLGLGWLSLVPTMALGGLPYLQHYTLRLLLILTRRTPRNYVHFLDYATDCILLRRVGGRWIFVHRLLMEYFAGVWEEKEGRAP